MKRHRSAYRCAGISAAVLFFVGSVICSASAHAASFRPLSLYVSDLLNSDGSHTFSLRSSSFTPFNRTETLHLPSGVTIDDAPFATPPTFPTLQELTTAIVGEWTFTTAPDTDPAAVEEYRFFVGAFGTGDVTVDRPEILQPINGSRVSTPFDITWSPPTSSFAYGAAGVPVAHALVEPGRLRITYREPLHERSYISFSTSESQSLHQFVTESPPPNDATYDLDVRLLYSKVASIRVFPVPEPTGVTGICTCILLTPISRRFFNKASHVNVKRVRNVTWQSYGAP